MATATDVIASLKQAADAASNAYDAAVAANPDGDFKALHKAKMAAADAAAAAIGKALTGDPAVTAAQKNLDAATADLNSKLATLKDLATWLGLLNNLVSLVTTLSRFLA
jgi:hypothetical protein